MFMELNTTAEEGLDISPSIINPVFLGEKKLSPKILKMDMLKGYYSPWGIFTLLDSDFSQDLRRTSLFKDYFELLLMCSCWSRTDGLHCTARNNLWCTTYPMFYINSLWTIANYLEVWNCAWDQSTYPIQPKNSHVTYSLETRNTCSRLILWISKRMRAPVLAPSEFRWAQYPNTKQNKRPSQWMNFSELVKSKF